MQSVVVGLLLLIAIAASLVAWLVLKAPTHAPAPTPTPAPSPTPTPAPAPTPFACSSGSPYISSSKASPENYQSCGIFIVDGPALVKEEPVKTALANMQKDNYGPGSNGQWIERHYAFLFASGNYTDSFQDGSLSVGYYTQVMGLTGIAGNVTLPIVCLGDDASALSTFWRSVENCSLAPMSKMQANPKQRFTKSGAFSEGLSTWAVSQASPMRRCMTTAKLALATSCGTASCFASGGFSADNVFGDQVLYAGQQQWMSLCDTYSNAQVSQMPIWNAVFVGCTNAPSGEQECSRQAGDNSRGILTNVKLQPGLQRCSKPYLKLQSDNSVGMVVPTGSVSANAACAQTPEEFVLVYDEPSLQCAVAEGKTRIVLASTGPLSLTSPVRVTTRGTVILGIGVPTLRLANSSAYVAIMGDECCLAGLTVEAGTTGLDTMVIWSGGNGRAYDLYTRVGGALPCKEVGCNTQLQVSGTASLVAENLWLWRADHDKGRSNTVGQNACSPELVGGAEANKCATGLLLKAGGCLDCLGLASEHNQADNVLWGGIGSILFYQSELDYCAEANFKKPGLTIAKGADFTGRGLGIYSFFAQPKSAPVVDTGINVEDPGNGVDVDGAITVCLDGHGGIGHVLNEFGCSVLRPQQVAVYLPKAPPSAC